jgi:cob(I)alamin adenosyltransferase
MPIYTRTGDKGSTSLFNGKRISKADPRVEAYASADELTTLIGFAIAIVKDKNDKNLLLSLQKDIYLIMSHLAGAKVDIVYLKERVKSFEQIIDKIASKLSKLNRFILPGGTELSSRLHLCRIACRTVERRVVSALKKTNKVHQKKIVKYILPYFNRLSDLFFVLARKYNQRKEVLT